MLKSIFTIAFSGLILSIAQNLNYHLQKKCESQFFTNPQIFQIEKYFQHYVNTTFKQVYEKQSPAGKHVLYQQLYEGYPIFYATIKVNYNLKNECTSIFSTALIYVQPVIYSFSQKSIAAQRLRISYMYQVEEGFLPISDSVIVPVFKVNVRDIGIGQTYYLHAHTLKTLYYQDNRTFFTKKSHTDTTGYVFYPDPLTSSGNTYGSCGTFCIDNNDANNPLLEAQRKEVTLKGLTYNSTTNQFELKGPYVEIVDLGTPDDTLAQSSTGKFDYKRHQQGFEQTNAYYFIDRMQRYVQCLGFNNIGNRPVRVDAHYGTVDNSFYLQPIVSGTAGDIHFGIGGVDDAEDMDVIIHEYSHALSNEASPNSNSGSQRMAVDEAIGDYFASSLSRAMYPYSAWYNVFNWDGHNTFWAGRVTNSTKKYPTNLTGNIYADAPIFSSALMDIWNDLGASKTDRLVLQMLYGLAMNMSMQDAALLLIQADCSLFGGAYFNTIKTHLVNRGLIPETTAAPSECSVVFLNACNFDEITHIRQTSTFQNFNVFPNPTQGTFFVEMPQNNSVARLSILDMLGREVFSKKVDADSPKVRIDISLPAGTYIVQCIVKDLVYHKVLIKE
ncbi:MAG: T9SS type A sorting domain-containing protein [Bacteroidia bacterium]|nr:T9SS type A sorting domain-containing protein [Bacteroidia bacterium]MDW8302291.1 T9SS type A sorting domain-containing protein [Bacteroidia bacterium]